MARTFGWVQDPSNFDSLIKVVEIFDPGTKMHVELKNRIIPKLVEKRDGRDHFLRELDKRPLKLKYGDLVGSSFQPRSESRCDGIVQAAIKGQRRPFLTDWAADNFVRWAHALGLINFDRETDSFEISDLGLELTHTKVGSKEEKRILEESFLSYPPVMRVLDLLAEDIHLTKFEIGQKLGFVGEDGFTNYPQKIIIMKLATTDDNKERNKMKTDWEGSADKYARMISTWISKLGWVKREPKIVTVKIGRNTYTDEIPQSYIITPEGLKARNRGHRVPKNVIWEMLCSENTDSSYIRTRRAHEIKILQRSSKILSIEDIISRLEKYDIYESEQVIQDDLQGIINIGLNIRNRSRGYFLYDTVNKLDIPSFTTEVTKKSDILQLKDRCRSKLKNLSHEYLTLIDLSFDNRQSILFEMQTVNLLVSECGFDGEHLGGPNKPDGAVYTSTNTGQDYGIIIDNKAYSNGFSIGQADEMVRYINDKIEEDIIRNPNEWWLVYPKGLKKYYFSFISSYFIGHVNDHLERISYRTGVDGAVLNSYNLLLWAEKIRSGEIGLLESQKLFEKNQEIILDNYLHNY